MSLLGFAQNHGTEAGIITGTIGTYDPETGLGDEMDSGDAALRLPGRAGNSASVPDSAVLSSFLDGARTITITAKIAPNAWVPDSDQVIVGKDTSAYYLGIQASTGKLFFGYSDGTPVVSTVAPGLTAENWVRLMFLRNDGAGGSWTKFYKSANGINWFQVGDTVTGAVGTINDNASALYIGSLDGTLKNFAGLIHRVTILNHSGTTVLDVPFTDQTVGDTSFTEDSAYAATVTVNQSGYPRAAIEWYPDRDTVHLIAASRASDEMAGVIDADHKRYLLPAEEVSTPPTTEHWLGIGAERWEINRVALAEKLGSAHFYLLDVTRVK